jgi:hypothetical protein
MPISSGSSRSSPSFGIGGCRGCGCLSKCSARSTAVVQQRGAPKLAIVMLPGDAAAPTGVRDQAGRGWDGAVSSLSSKTIQTLGQEPSRAGRIDPARRPVAPLAFGPSEPLVFSLHEGLFSWATLKPSPTQPINAAKDLCDLSFGTRKPPHLLGNGGWGGFSVALCAWSC